MAIILKKNGGTNDSDEAREELISKGPDKNGGFFTGFSEQPC